MELTPAAPRRSFAARRQAVLLAWAELLERTASDGPRLLRPLFAAELAFEAWCGVRWRRLRPVLAAALQAFLMVLAAEVADTVERLARHRTRLDAWARRHGEVRLAQTAIAASLVTVTLAVAAADAMHPTVRGFVVDRMANGRPAADEALGPEQPAAADPTAGVAAPAPVGAVAAGLALPTPPPSAPAIPTQRGPLPVGKGMWIYVDQRAEGGNPDAIVARAKATGLTHLYVRTGTLKEGFMGGLFLDGLLPKAHAAGIRVYAWDFPYLNDAGSDVNRAIAAINHRTPDGHRVDGYVADIELRSMGVNVNPQTASTFGSLLRKAVGPDFPLIACVPRPSPALVTYPFAEVTAAFDAVAPMVYWMGRDPAADIAGAIRDLGHLGKPIIPVGQAYDGFAEGGPPGVPPRDQLLKFMATAEQHGAIGVSWWSWQHADQQAWDAIRDAPQFTLPVGDGSTFTPGQVRSYQMLLHSLGFPMPITAAWDGATVAAVQAYQRAARLPVTGVIDAATRTVLLSPFGPPIQPQP
jgi:hypothetical protein